MMVDVIFLLIYYIKDASRNTRIPQDQKILWYLVIFFGNIIAYPIYWNIYIKKQTSK